MKRNEIMNTIRELAKSQGFYGRLLGEIESLDKRKKEMFFEYMEARNFKDSVGLVMFFEC